MTANPNVIQSLEGNPPSPANEHWREFAVRRGWETVAPIYEIVAGGGYIAGSYAAFMGSPNTCPVLPNDIDIFATSTLDAKRILGKLRRHLNLGRFAFDENEVAYSLTPRGHMPIQIVKPNPVWRDFPADIINSFDMAACRAVLISPETVIADEGVIYQTLFGGKLLRIGDPLRSLKRVLKYHIRGVAFNDHELLKLFQAWEGLSPERKRAALDLARAEAMPAESHSDDMSWDQDDDDYFRGE